MHYVHNRTHSHFLGEDESGFSYFLRFLSQEGFSVLKVTFPINLTFPIHRKDINAYGSSVKIYSELISIFVFLQDSPIGGLNSSLEGRRR